MRVITFTGSVRLSSLFMLTLLILFVGCFRDDSSRNALPSEDQMSSSDDTISVGLNEETALALLSDAFGDPEELAVQPPKDEAGRYKRLYYFRFGTHGVIQVTSKNLVNEEIWVIDKIMISNQFDALAKKEPATDWQSVKSLDVEAYREVKHKEN